MMSSSTVRSRSRRFAGIATILAVSAAITTPLAAAPASWSEKAELAASDGATGDDFGTSVSISGSTAVVGAPRPFANCCPGAVYVFVRSNGVWSEQQKLTPSDGATNDAFGAAVAVSGSTVMVGAPNKASQAGAAYVFVRSGGVWSQQAKLTASDGVAYDHFGSSVAVSSSTVVAGAPDKDSQTGAAYVFVNSGGIWSQQAKVTASDGAEHDFFGASVAASGSTAVIGAYGKVSPSGAFTGAAYVFVARRGVWSQQARLTADAGWGAYLGASVAISGSTAVVGAPLEPHTTGIGGAYVFVRTGNTWSKPTTLSAPDGVQGDQMGHAVSISGSTVVASAVGDDASAGSAYVFVNSGGIWSEQGKLTASDGAPEDQFGNSVSISGSTMVAGAWLHDSTTGAAYVFLNG